MSGMPRATFFSARQRTPQPGASRSEAPWQQFLRHPGKFVVGDDLHPLGLRSAKYNLMTSPGSWFHLFSPQGKHPKEDQHQVLVTGSSPNPADECFFYQATTQVSARTGKPTHHYAPIELCKLKKMYLTSVKALNLWDIEGSKRGSGGPQIRNTGAAGSKSISMASNDLDFLPYKDKEMLTCCCRRTGKLICPYTFQRASQQCVQKPLKGSILLMQKF